MMSSLSYMEVLELGSTMYGNCFEPPNSFAFGRNVGPSAQSRKVVDVDDDARQHR